MAEYHIVIRKKGEDGQMHTIADNWFDSGVQGRGQKVLDALEALVGLRPEVLAFAQLMEEKLRKHDLDRGKQGWKDDDPWGLFQSLEKEVGELRLAMAGHNCDLTELAMLSKAEVLAREAADVANFAMMIADVVGGLK